MHFYNHYNFGVSNFSWVQINSLCRIMTHKKIPHWNPLGCGMTHEVQSVQCILPRMPYRLNFTYPPASRIWSDLFPCSLRRIQSRIIGWIQLITIHPSLGPTQAWILYYRLFHNIISTDYSLIYITVKFIGNQRS